MIIRNIFDCDYDDCDYDDCDPNRLDEYRLNGKLKEKGGEGYVIA